MYTIEEILQNKQVINSFAKASDYLKQIIADKDSQLIHETSTEHRANREESHEDRTTVRAS
jgi:hypothetical protein